MGNCNIAITLVGCVLLGGAVFSECQTSHQNGGCSFQLDVPPGYRYRPVIKLHLENYVAPDYPALARKAYVKGQVRIQAHITEKGEVRNPQLLSGHPMLAKGALATVVQWRYGPACLKGTPVAIEYLIVVNFDPEDGVTVP
jgi:TonB family protein